MRRFPFLSLGLLLTAYATFGWFLYRETAPWLIWFAVIVFTLGQALLLTTFATGLRIFIRKWLRSDIGYFSIVILSALSIAFVLVWYHTFAYVLIVIASELLARLDLQSAGYDAWQTLSILTIVSILGLAVGWSILYIAS